ncbi:mitotic spindle checkpoint protein Bub3 [Schizosaccharomyces cryophilus OY26]|uniref:Mitotic spindle checkpoint protein Bub3 n=1 Tax=Schizosaccharomyces cryophilus (strain OY26 / ATCC MYA-4695 / CBS 11777 / NBRC 106824 / NRRL Y48691) TaxID=653667 RepID=S9W205_SCHCR|nr:mitotic spindle checkpoint protein Bub3 [Schizosaccharomyces cryophilus OY26]EPY52374.1 mitotic spindle checkpoint protein Bub3 [Schizosaccharomyces cryophilus OY26]
MPSILTRLNDFKDGISSIKFSPVEKDHLLIGSWDNGLKLVKATEEQHCLQSYPVSNPVLTVGYLNATTAFAGSLEGLVHLVDIPSGTHLVIGKHGKGVSCTANIQESDCFVTGSWDQSFQLWDARQKNAIDKRFIEKKILAASSAFNILVFGCTERENLVYDIRNLKMPFQRKPSTFKYMTRDVCCLPGAEGFVSSSIEGRTSVEYLNPSPEWQIKNFTFKCHRQIQQQHDIVYPVNSLAFHPIHQTLATAGGDGSVAFWDIQVRKRLRVLYPSKTNVSSVAFNFDASLLSVATCAQDEANGNVYIYALESDFASPKKST